MKEARGRKGTRKKTTTTITPGNKDDPYDIDSVLALLGEKEKQQKGNKKTLPKQNKVDFVFVNDRWDKSTPDPVTKFSGMKQVTRKPVPKPKPAQDSGEEFVPSSLQICTTLVEDLLADVFFVTKCDGYSVPTDWLKCEMAGPMGPVAPAGQFYRINPGQKQGRIAGYVRCGLGKFPKRPICYSTSTFL